MIIIKKYWLSATIILIIFVLSLMSREELPQQPVINFDKIVHTIMYGGLSCVIFFDGTNRFRLTLSKNKIFYSVLIFPIVLGGVIELLQENFTETRSGDWFDFLFNAIGSILACAIALIINNKCLK